MNDRPSLNALRAFHAVARTGSLSAAAAELSVTTSAVSRQIRNLEESIGLALIVRDGRGVRLTADGRELQNGLSDAFLKIAQSVDGLRRPALGEKLRVMVPPIFASTWLLPRLGRFREIRPEIEIVLLDSREMVSASSLDEVVVEWGVFEEDATTVCTRLTDNEEIFPVCGPGACPGPGLAGATLLEREVVGRGWNWPDWPTFLAAVGLAGIETEGTSALTARLLLEAARQGRGVILACTTIAREDLAAGSLVRPVPESLPVDDSYWLLVYRPAFRRPEVRAFAAWLGEEAGRGASE
ncbi:MAG: LysR family transcriptional regulator [Defluviicoccus sp.]|nr:LysR family transcriptional regulator [Defluviicoccus sp.]MDE0277794.1 LysR family transcriptional regulator [Defluviicoccus sp.]